MLPTCRFSDSSRAMLACKKKATKPVARQTLSTVLTMWTPVVSFVCTRGNDLQSEETAQPKPVSVG